MAGVGGATLLLLLTAVVVTAADDRITCCMGGWKVVRGVTLCDEPCCRGYEERVLDMPLLRRPVICHKLSKQELKAREALKTTTPPPLEINMLEDEPRHLARPSSQFKEFLYQHRRLFLEMVASGYSKKELMASFEKFLDDTLNAAYQSHWYRG